MSFQTRTSEGWPFARSEDLILQDPLATQLGSSVVGFAKGVPFSSLAEQSIQDCFRMKSSATSAEACKFTVAIGKGAQSPRCSQPNSD